MVMPRPTWEETFMQIAETVSKRSTCLRRKVGAVLVKDKHILATGYNGAGPGLPHCSEVGCIRQKENIPSGERHEKCRGTHAEANLIIQSAIHGRSAKGAEVYVTCYPCSMCAKLLVGVGVVRVNYSGEYNDPLAKQIFEQAGIEVRHIENYFVGEDGGR